MAEQKILSRETFDDLLVKVNHLKESGSKLDITDTYYFKESVNDMLGSNNFNKMIASSWENAGLIQFLTVLLPMYSVKELSAVHPLFRKLLDVTHCYGTMVTTYDLDNGTQTGQDNQGEFLKWLLYEANQNNSFGSPRNFYLLKDEYPELFQVLNMFAWNRMTCYKSDSGTTPALMTDNEFEEYQPTYLLRILFQYGLTDGLIFLDAISEAKTIAIEKGWFVPFIAMPT